MVAGALARLGKLGDGSARRDVEAPRLELEALAVGLAVAIIVIVEVDGHERLAIFSFAHVPALTDALRVTHELVHAGEVLPGLVVLTFSMLRANNFMVSSLPSDHSRTGGASNQSRRQLPKIRMPNWCRLSQEALARN